MRTSSSDAAVLPVQIRWLVVRDLPEVLEIERASFPADAAWDENDFRCALKQRSVIGMVAEHGGHVVGFMIYELHKQRLDLWNFAVYPAFRRQRVGAQLVQRLKDKIAAQKRREILLKVRETNLPGQLFFRSRGFEWVGTERDAYDDCDESAYVMRFVLPGAAEEPAEKFAPRNRIKNWLPPVE
jgi:ribosomal-protein-alanine N-acetyltransferase